MPTKKSSEQSYMKYLCSSLLFFLLLIFGSIRQSCRNWSSRSSSLLMKWGTGRRAWRERWRWKETSSKRSNKSWKTSQKSCNDCRIHPVDCKSWKINWLKWWECTHTRIMMFLRLWNHHRLISLIFSFSGSETGYIILVSYTRWILLFYSLMYLSTDSVTAALYESQFKSILLCLTLASSWASFMFLYHRLCFVCFSSGAWGCSSELQRGGAEGRGRGAPERKGWTRLHTETARRRDGDTQHAHSCTHTDGHTEKGQSNEEPKLTCCCFSTSLTDHFPSFPSLLSSFLFLSSRPRWRSRFFRSGLVTVRIWCLYWATFQTRKSCRTGSLPSQRKSAASGKDLQNSS